MRGKQWCLDEIGSTTLIEFTGNPVSIARPPADRAAAYTGNKRKIRLLIQKHTAVHTEERATDSREIVHTTLRYRCARHLSDENLSTIEREVSPLFDLMDCTHN
jgi:hypothetical protein